MNFLTEHGIDTYPDLESRVAEITAASDEAAAALKAMEHRLADMAVLIKNVTTYKQLRPVSMEYRKAAECRWHFAGEAGKEMDTRVMSIPRMNYPQYRKVRRLTHECCNYCNGNCLLLDDGEECVCVQSISYSLLCRWFQAAVLPLDAALYAEIIKDRD